MKPSITTKGPVSAVIELIPRYTDGIVFVGLPEPERTDTPAIRPCNASDTLPVGVFFNASAALQKQLHRSGHSYVERRNPLRQLPAAIGCLLPVYVDFGLSAYGNLFYVSDIRYRRIRELRLPEHWEECSFKSISVIHPLLVPSTWIEAPITGPKLSVTVPVTVRFCALACVANGTESNIIPNALKKLDFCFININLISY